MKQRVRGVVSEKSIVLHYGGQAITIQSETDRLLFEEFKHLIKSGEEEELIKRFLDVKARIEKYTDKTFYVKDGSLYLKGDETPIPQQLAEKLLELEESGGDFMPLIRFWRKLKNNPSKESIQQLYGFMVATRIPITELGDLVVEKGVSQRRGGTVGELVDTRTGKVDNSIGMEVSMRREDVDPNPNQTCSFGLHVGAPDYVRRHYSNNIIVKCIVNPMDVVAVPTDYNNTKMRVCRYVVAGFSDKTKDDYKPVYKLSDFVNLADDNHKEIMERESAKEGGKLGKDPKVKSSKKEVTADDKKFEKAVQKYIKKLQSKTAREIVQEVKDNYNVEMTQSLKSKSSILKGAAKIMAREEELNS